MSQDVAAQAGPYGIRVNCIAPETILTERNLERIPKGVNCISFVPVSPLMVYVMGLEAAKSRPATPHERKEMQRL